MIKLIDALENEPGKNKKIELLEKYAKTNLVKKILLEEVLEYTYNPFKNFYIKKIPSASKGKKTFNIANWEEIKILLNNLMERKITGNLAISTVGTLLENYSVKAQEIITRIIKKDLKCGVNTKTINTVFPKLIPVFKVQLANNYSDFVNKKKKMSAVEKWYASPKLDGLRCLYINGKLFSRNGKEIIGFEHIVRELDKLGNYKLIDGELYSHVIPFQKIQGTVLRYKNINDSEKRQILFNIFAMIKDGTRNTTEMIEDIKVKRNQFKLEYVTFLNYTLIDNNFKKIKQYDKMFVDEGYEGVMLRDIDTPYEWKRSDALLKFKSFKEADFKVNDVKIGQKGTKYELVMGKVVIKGTYNGHKIEAECGSGFSDEEREYYWKNPKELIGKTIEVKFQNLTDDKTSLRFPIFKGLKLDR